MSRELTVDSLTVRVCDPDELPAAAAEDAAGVVADAVAARGAANVMFATGNSQLAFLGELATSAGVDWTQVTAFHMDEYVGLGEGHPASFARYIRARVGERLRPGATHLIDGTADQVAECARYAALLRDHPLDLCCLGIGENGHLAFNDPPVADFADPHDVKVVELDDDCRRQQVSEGHFPTVADVPRHAITVTIPALLRAATVLAIVPEARKAEPVRTALTGPITPACPASALRRHPNARLYLDTASARLL